MTAPTHEALPHQGERGFLVASLSHSSDDMQLCQPVVVRSMGLPCLKDGVAPLQPIYLNLHSMPPSSQLAQERLHVGQLRRILPSQLLLKRVHITFQPTAPLNLDLELPSDKHIQEPQVQLVLSIPGKLLCQHLVALTHAATQLGCLLVLGLDHRSVNLPQRVFGSVLSSRCPHRCLCLQNFLRSEHCLFPLRLPCSKTYSLPFADTLFHPCISLYFRLLFPELCDLCCCRKGRARCSTPNLRCQHEAPDLPISIRWEIVGHTCQ
mmetsp:Transcript_41322/g.74720  ORF Transcript_41322/g.74720 Transcript_41322/m.74720 type:complete len:265 (+) Transcript_41322:1614-2408(+)